jgi:enhanced entry protein EnhC
MKTLAPLMCFIVASASHQAFADETYNAYRLGIYDRAAEPLISKNDKDAVADYYLGRLFLYGYGQLKNNNVALRYFKKSAEKGYLPAVLLMAKYELLHEKNPEKAVGWFKQAATDGDISSQLFMAAAYQYGLGVKQNADVATKYYIDAAKNGNPIAQYALAEHFLESKHSSNYKLGVIWLTKAANSGNPKALTKLGSLYVQGKLVDQDLDKAIELLNKAVSDKYVPAQVELGKAALAKDQYEDAVKWFTQAADESNVDAYLQLAHVYLDQDSKLYDPKTGFMWVLKAAQSDSIEGQKQLANLYQNGVGVQADPSLAKQWADKAVENEKKKVKAVPAELAALWLTNGLVNRLEESPYQMQGIFSTWNNPAVLRNNTYNQSPKLDLISRQDLFKPKFELTQPNEIPISNYYDALISKSAEFSQNEEIYPIFRLNPYIEALERANGYVFARMNLPAPYIDANYYLDSNPNQEDESAEYDSLSLWTQGWQQKANYMSVVNQLYSRAILGDAQAQFEIGQLFQFGIGLNQDSASAAIFYENSAEQQHLGAEYNIGILSLRNAKDAKEYQAALNWLTDSAFKGNKQAQFALASLLREGRKDTEGQELVKANPQQAMSMLYLSAANHYGPAEYVLAEHLVRDNNNELSVDVKKQKIALVRKLYEGAAKNGVAQALLPLAFYNAIDNNQEKQKLAFKVAEEQADLGDENAALLLGMLYDRGIGTSADPAKAIYWYEKAGENPVSQFIMGTYLTEGKGVAEDKEKGRELLKNSADAQFSYADFNLAVLNKEENQEFLTYLTNSYKLGNSNAGIVLADYYLSENSEAEKMNQAKEIYEGLSKKGDQYAQLKLGYMLENGLGMDVDPVAAQHWYTASAEQGNADGQYLLGQLYQLGAVGEPDYAQAKYWYKKAAEQLPRASVALGFIYETVDDNYSEAIKAYEAASVKGDAYGSYDLALIYEYGKGVPVDYQKAKTLFTEAAEKGIDSAMNQLAGMYFYGLGSVRNDQQAISWYKKAADLGNGNALYTLGLLSETGVGTKLDFPNALNYYQKASDQGNEKAMLALARMYHYGLGVEKDTKVSASIYQKLAAKQNAYAQYQLGTYYLEGIAGERMPEKGKELLEQASENGNFQAQKALQKLNAMTQNNVSYVEPVLINVVPKFKDLSADRIYYDALNEWNHGDELISRMILQRLVTQFPNYTPAKQIYERVNQTSSASIYG